MSGRLSQRVRGLVFLAGGAFAALLLVYLAFNPAALGTSPVPLIALLVFTLLVAVWQAFLSFR